MYSHKGGFDNKETRRFPDGSYEVTTINNHGLSMKVFYPHKDIKFSGQWRHGLPMGTHTSYFENGKKEWEARYNSDGVLHGDQQGWYPDGTFETKQFRKNGHLVGTSRWFYSNGEIKDERIHHEDGLTTVKKYTEGSNILGYEYSFKNSEIGNDSEESMGVKHGWEIWYFEDGSRKCEKRWENNQLTHCKNF
jgi:antitoxin component YwqK of YwqJK toxin-antitoxin module